MSESYGARQKRAASVEEVASTTPRRRVETRSREDEFASIKENTFFGIMFDPNLTPSQKKAEVAKSLVATKDKERDKARVAEFERFKEFLQANREQMASEIIALTNTETFAQLKSVYEDMNGGLIDFEEKMKPLTDILDSVYKLRTDGATLDVFRSINEDRKRSSTLNAEIGAIEDDVYEIEYWPATRRFWTRPARSGTLWRRELCTETCTRTTGLSPRASPTPSCARTWTLSTLACLLRSDGSTRPPRRLRRSTSFSQTFPPTR